MEQEVLGRIKILLSSDTTRTPEKTMLPTILRYSAHVFTEMLPSNDMGTDELQTLFDETRTA
jgi:hypothetical protein